MKEKPVVVPDADADYIIKNHTRESVPTMAKALKRANVTIYAYMDALALEPLAREIKSNHPFKRANRRLETMLLGHRIENSRRQNLKNLKR